MLAAVWPASPIAGDDRRVGTMKRCELCELSHTTKWHAEHDEPFRFVILDCDSCDVPMAVLGAHRSRPTDDERAVLQRELARVADDRYPQGWWFDDHMRQIPEHYHVHARPYPRGWPKPPSSE